MSEASKKNNSIKRQAAYDKKQSLILKAASRVMAKDGFEGATIRNVAARGKIGLSNIYYYFKSKDELLFAIQYHTFSSLIKSLEERLKVAKDPETRLEAVIRNHFEFFVNNMDDLKVCVHEIESLSGKYYREVYKVRREYYLLVRGVVADIYDGSMYDTDLSTLFLFGSLNWVYMWYDPEVNRDIDKLTSRFLTLFLNGIQPPTAA
jgi:AcrR family transcriptional regulator